MTFKKTKLVLGVATASLMVGAAFVSPEALAHKSSKKTPSPCGFSLNT
jgi:hypothetical protein